MVLQKNEEMYDITATFPELNLEDPESLFRESMEDLAKRLAAIDRASVVTADVMHVQFTL